VVRLPAMDKLGLVGAVLDLTTATTPTVAG
jgi:hypothetical protein